MKESTSAGTQKDVNGFVSCYVRYSLRIKCRQIGKKPQWKTYLLAEVCSLASHVTVLTYCATLEALARVAHLLTFAINGAGLVASLASRALLMAIALAVLVTPEICCTVLLTIATAAILIALLFSSDYHLLASTQLCDKKSGNILAKGSVKKYSLNELGQAGRNDIRLSVDLYGPNFMVFLGTSFTVKNSR